MKRYRKCTFTLVYYLIIAALFTAGIGMLLNSCDKSDPTAPPEPVEYAVQYQVSGVPDEVITILYTGADGLVQIPHPSLPWDVSVAVEGSVLLELTVSNGANPGEFGATITVDGVQVASGMAEGYLHLEYQLP